MSLEKWVKINGYENYSVSSWGRVRNDITRDLLHQEKHEKGYMRVDLFDEDRRRKHMKVHRLVAQAFVPNPDGKPDVNHIDGNNRNNSFTNLEWVTDAENKAKAKALRTQCKE